MPETAHTTVPDVPTAHDPLLDVGVGVGGLGGVAALLLTLERMGVITLPRRGQSQNRNDAEITAISQKVETLTQRMGTLDTRLAEMAGTDALHAHRLDSMQEQIQGARADIRQAIDLLQRGA